MSGFKESFYQNFIEKDRWQYLLTGLENTLLITIFAVLIGVAIGFLVAIIRASHDKNGSLKILNFICRVYLTVIRGTPTMIQLMITYYIIFASVNVSKIFVAVCAFGINSGAYVAEIVRSGIMSIDQGQFEAGRSLGFNYVQTMRLIILPQAFKNVLPALGNEMIVLLKETSISGYVGTMDLTKGGDIIRCADSGTGFKKIFWYAGGIRRDHNRNRPGRSGSHHRTIRLWKIYLFTLLKSVRRTDIRNDPV